MIAIMSDGFVQQLIDRADMRRKLGRNTYLFHQSDPVRSIYVVKVGVIALTRRKQDGEPTVLQRALSQEIVAEASVYTQNYHCDGLVMAPSEIYELKKTDFLRLLREDEKMSESWARHLAREVQAARNRIEIYSQKTVAERLDGWMAWQGDQILSKGQWKDIAEQIGVSPEALYRELAKRRSDQ